MNEIEIDSYHWHELLDRSHLIAELFSEWICQHPATSTDTTLKKTADQLAEALADFYQLVGNYQPD